MIALINAAHAENLVLVNIDTTKTVKIITLKDFDQNHLAGIQAASLRPFVPGVNSNQFGLLRMLIDKSFCFPEILFKFIRCRIGNIPSLERIAEIRIPTYDEIREIRNRKLTGKVGPHIGKCIRPFFIIPSGFCKCVQQ